MCSVTNLLQLICLTVTVINAVDGFSFFPNSTRIRREAKKNGHKANCPNSSDFVCKSGECIEEDKECDGTVDCKDGSDESNSCHRFKCQQFLFRCKYGACISSDLECDGKQDCRDNSDETSPNCKNTSPAPVETCGEKEFRCNSGECIDDDLKCDGKKNCIDASDESSATCWNMKCPGFTYRCKYGACVDGDAECNGIIDCFDGSDEDPTICKKTTPPPVPDVTPAPPGPDVPEGSCALPPHPDFGHWSVFGATQSFLPGTPVSTGTIVKVQCQIGYRLERESTIFCEEGKWSAPVSQCAKTCPPIKSTHNMEVTCYYTNRQIVNCSEAVDGTIAKFKCAPFYEDQGLANMPVHLCRDGSWNQRRPECVPACGRKSVSATTLIVNGTTVKQGDYPWQVALYNVHSKSLICGGSMITQRIVLTAAHCVATVKGQPIDKSNYKVAVGKYYRPMDDPRDKNEAQFSDLEAIFVSDLYKGSIQNYVGDIAILVTKQTFTLSRRSLPVCVDWGQNYASELSSPIKNRFGYVVGWGYTKENAEPSEELKELKVPPVTYAQCNENLPEDYQQFLTHDKICAGYLGQGTAVCKGDSGGGLVFKYNERYYITGVVSLSPRADTGGCSSQQYGLYTSVYKYIEEFLLDKVSRYKPSEL